jgi:hypothetical protein
MTAQLILLVIGFSVFGLLFAAYLARWVLRFSTGSAAMQRISNAIKEGAEAFLRRQNRTIIGLALLFAIVLFLGYGVIREHRAFDPVGSSLQLAFWITLSFILGKMNAILTIMPNPKPMIRPTTSATIQMLLFLREFSGTATG